MPTVVEILHAHLSPHGIALAHGLLSIKLRGLLIAYFSNEATKQVQKHLRPLAT